jgi:putative transposase
MGRQRFTPEQIIAKLREVEVLVGRGVTAVEACRQIGIAEQTLYRWRKEYGGLKVDQARRMGVTTLYNLPGSAWENGYIEGFNARLRDELLNGKIFYGLEEVRCVTGWWRDHYNRARPHSSLGCRPPVPETIMMPAWPLGSATLRVLPRLASEPRIN